MIALNTTGNSDGDNGGQGASVSILADPHRTASDINLARRAVRQRWPVKDEHRGIVVDRLMDIVQKAEVSVMTKEGPEKIEGPADSNAIAAARVLVAMESQNQADEHHAAPAPQNVNVNVSVDDRRSRLAAISARLGIEGVVVDAQPLSAAGSAGADGGNGHSGHAGGDGDGSHGSVSTPG
jgi:hypothetical protein